MKLSLAMIVKGGGDPEALRRSLRSIVPFVDEVCVLATIVGEQKTMDLHMAASDVCRDLEVPLRWEEWRDEEGSEEFGCVHDFAEARNRAQAMVTGDVWCWIDSDTILVHGAAWREKIEEAWEQASDPPFGLMEVNYLYDFEEDGKPNREVKTRMVFRTGMTEWKWPVHEQAQVLKGPYGSLDASKENFHLRHVKSREDHDRATRRNLWIIENHIQSGGEMDARMWLSLAQSQVGLEKYDEAMWAIRECLCLEPGASDKWRALSTLGGLLHNLGAYDDALTAFGEMAAIAPQRKTPWAMIAEVHCAAGRHPEALAAVGRMSAFDDVDEGPTHNPFFLRYNPLYVAARSYAALGELDQAIDAYDRLLKIAPNIDHAREHREALKEQAVAIGVYKAHQIVAQSQGDSVWKKAPASIDMVPEVARAKRPKRPKGKQTIMLWCGPGASGPWGPSDLAKGCGGSEEAVIYLSRELVKQGFHVEVYAQPHVGEAGLDEHGVAWIHHSGWEDQPGVFVQWRGVHMVEAATKASARYVWLHDVIQFPQVYGDDLKPLVDGVFCLSEFHAKPLVEHGWGDKVIFTKNGLSPDLLAMEVREPKRNSFAYYSSPDRGLDKLLDVWRDVRYAIPEATLDIYYGFTPYYMKAMVGNPHLRRLKAKIEKQVSDLEGCGVTWRGMVGQEELHESMATTEFWLYPTAWPETSCITGMKCQALGCVPVTSRYPDSGVPETVQYDLGPEPRGGSIYEDFEWLTEWKDRVIEVAKMPPELRPVDRQEMVEWARQHYDWRIIASQWAGLFGPSRSASTERRSSRKTKEPAGAGGDP